MKGVITAPKEIITGAFNIRFDFIRPIELTAADITVKTIAGDPLGHAKDSFGGSGASYYILCYIPDARSGSSRISVTKEGVDVVPVEITYDTIKTVRATRGTPIQRGNKIEIPISLDAPIQNLKKRNFCLVPPGRFQLYGADESYSLIVPSQTVTVSILGTVRKKNGLVSTIAPTQIEVT